MSAPKIKRTRGHVVLRLTPVQARAAGFLMHAVKPSDLPKRSARACSGTKKLLLRASELADQIPVTRPPANSFSGGNHRKGDGI